MRSPTPGDVRKALQARHLRGMEVGCGELRQCVWLPYPHHIDPWCSGVDFLYDIDYRERVASGNLTAADVSPQVIRQFKTSLTARRFPALRNLPDADVACSLPHVGEEGEAAVRSAPADRREGESWADYGERVAGVWAAVVAILRGLKERYQVARAP